MIDTTKVYVNRTFECSADALYDWLTKPELIVQWFGPKGFSVGNVQTDLKEGGSYSIELNRDQLSFTVLGKYTQLIKPKSINFTYRYQGMDSPPPPSTVSITLNEINEKSTSLNFVQQFESPTPDYETRTKAWDYMFTELNSLISN